MLKEIERVFLLVSVGLFWLLMLAPAELHVRAWEILYCDARTCE